VVHPAGRHCDLYKGPPPDVEFAKLPKTVHFRFGFAIPATYVNCQNPDNDPASPIPGEEHQRGVQVKPNTSTIVQLTVHTDHMFWEKLAHEQPLHFDQIACAYVGIDSPTASLADMASLDYTGSIAATAIGCCRIAGPDYTPVSRRHPLLRRQWCEPARQLRGLPEYSTSTDGQPELRWALRGQATLSVAAVRSAPSTVVSATARRRRCDRRRTIRRVHPPKECPPPDASSIPSSAGGTTPSDGAWNADPPPNEDPPLG